MPTRSTFLSEELDIMVLDFARKHEIMRATLKGTKVEGAVPNIALAIRKILEEYFDKIAKV